jgi:predicted transcriptional regulator
MNNKELLSKLKPWEYYLYSSLKEYPSASVKELYTDINMSKRALYRNLKWLVGIGFVEEFDAETIKGRLTVKRYRVVLGTENDN